ncbi:uncharacterized protein EV422DRAFT_536762 [Fimicolochytrium jonesii]|uniref:uncharacterized protein n=1 Tax=Fimicolochytrium jonesii TaxID=1396493 RepID=UPI0022FDC1FE|nr:uncharacterized protein EV422DRAFT_536762 [Fimicolochytrium jonesii]KAI8818767.1 hypothetical protein EV422DRAFT_536762 [Fimicolochytrium jonesii]
MVIHALEDDLGLGNAVTSRTTGNAGARVACGINHLDFIIKPNGWLSFRSPPLPIFACGLAQRCRITTFQPLKAADPAP